jgi:hypothetical protein
MFILLEQLLEDLLTPLQTRRDPWWSATPLLNVTSICSLELYWDLYVIERHLGRRGGSSIFWPRKMGGALGGTGGKIPEEAQGSDGLSYGNSQPRRKRRAILDWGLQMIQ